MKRRAFLGSLAAGLVTAPLAAGAQQTEKKPYRIAILGNVPLNDAEGARLWGALSQGLRDLGYVEGQNIVVNHQSSEGRYERLPALAAELIRWKPDVIVVPNNSNALAARDATRTIPIVAATLAEASGLIASLARPGGNVTGLTLFSSEMVVKQLELLKEMVSRVTRVALLLNPSSPAVQAVVDRARGAARTLALQLQPVEARRPEDIEPAFASMSRGRAGALVVLADAMCIIQRVQLVNRAATLHLPAMYSLREYMGVGALAFYGPSMADNFRRAAFYVDKILKGAKPADLPVEQPTKFELVINLKTAKALGLTIPPSLLLRADEVIQ